MANGTLKVSNIETSSGSGTITIGQSGETINIPSGCTITNSGTQTGFGGTNTPNFHAFLGSSQDIANNTTTTVVFNTETYDSASAYDASTGIFTVPSGQAGKYFIAASIKQTSATDYDNFQCRITVNSKSITSVNSNFNQNTVNSSTVYNLSVGDTVKVQTYQNSGSTKAAAGNASEDLSWFTMFKIIE